MKLTGARFVDARTPGLSFHDSLLVGADLKGLSFRKQTLEALSFSDADLSDCDFRDACSKAAA
nr:pentapeptide repeat-containing protein [Paraburkholderia sp. CNPSo 3274]